MNISLFGGANISGIVNLPRTVLNDAEKAWSKLADAVSEFAASRKDQLVYLVDKYKPRDVGQTQDKAAKTDKLA